jgi:hypothetical protein
MTKIKISHSRKFYLFIFPKFKYEKSIYDASTNDYSCAIEGDLISANYLFLIDFKKIRCTKLDFRKHSYQKPIYNIKYPVVFPDYSKPKLGCPIEVISKPLTIENQPISLTKTQPLIVITKPIDLIISNNINICQTHLTQQIQSCQVLSQQVGL